MLSRTRTASPRGHLLLGHALALNRDPLGFLLRCARDYGDFVPLRTGYARAVLVSEPQAIEEVFVTQHPNFIKGPGLRRSAAVFGNGLLTSEGAFWRRQRRLVQPAFHRERIAAYTEVMVAETLRRMESWQDGEVRDIHAEMMPLMLQIAVKTLFGTEVAEAQQVARAMEVGQENFARWMGYLAMLPDWLATPTPPGLARAVRQLDGVVYGLIRARRESGEEGGDLLSLLLRAQDEDDGAHMTDKQLRDEVLTLLLAGHETTALALTWAFLLLARHPEASARLADELHTVLNGRSPTAEDRPQLIFTEQVILEAMRLYPPAWAVSRTALADCTIAGHLIPAGTTVMMSQYVVHRDHRFFVEPECFRPERWAGGFARALPKYAYFPFGGGPRICIGNTFALMEAALALAAIAQTYRFTLAPGPPIVPRPAVTLRPRDGVRLVFHRN